MSFDAPVIIYSFFFWLFWSILVSLFMIGFVEGSTHWIVTEDGRIQAQADSMFNLQCPFDVMALLRQEQRRELIESLRKELLDANTMESQDEKDIEFEKNFYATDPDCLLAGKTLAEFDLYVSAVVTHENKGIRTEDYIPMEKFKKHIVVPGKVPRCREYVHLDFSMHAFEHFEGMFERHNLSLMDESKLDTVLPNMEDLERFSSYVASELENNSTSWVFYNLAAFYWRRKGDYFEAVECIRRSLHFSPRKYKDIALVSLSNILHRSHHSTEAVIVLRNALDVSNILAVGHFALGNIYAVLGDFNNSVICYENALRLEADFTEVRSRKHAVLCHSKLETLLDSKQRSLQKTLDDLRKIQERHEIFHALQKKMHSEQLFSEERTRQVAFYDAHVQRTKQLSKEPRFSILDFRFLLNDNRIDSGNLCLASCRKNTTVESVGKSKDSSAAQRDREVKKPKNDPHDYTLFLQKHLKKQQSFSNKNLNFDGQTFNFLSGQDQKSEHQSSTVPPSTVKTDLPNLVGDWPSEDECNRNVQHFPNWSEFQTVYLSLERKGFDVTHMLGIGQGLEAWQSHPFPWYPPLCTSPSSSASSDIPEGPNTYDHISAVRDRASLRVKLEDSAMKEVLIMHVLQDAKLEITIEEIGQRILTALENNIGPSWVLYNMAGLFWRIVGNPLNSIQCIRRALHFVPSNFRDVPIVNLASVLYKIGRVKDAIKVMKDALAINSYEPDSLFFMGNLLAALGNVSGAVSYYQEALKIDSSHEAVLKNLRMVLCFKKFHLGHQTLVTPAAQAAAASNGEDGEIGGGSNKNNNVILAHKKANNIEETKMSLALSDVCSKDPNGRDHPMKFFAPQGNDICGHSLVEHSFCEDPMALSFIKSREDCLYKSDEDFALNLDKLESCHKIPANIIRSLNNPSCKSEYIQQMQPYFAGNGED